MVGRVEDRPVPELSELIVAESPSVPPVRVVEEDRGMTDTMLAASSAAASLENCDSLCQLPLGCNPSKGLLFGTDEEGR